MWCKGLWWRCEIKEQKKKIKIKRAKKCNGQPEKKITIVCFLSIMPFTHSDVIYFHSIVVDIFTKTLYFTESYFFELFNCNGFMASWQVLSLNCDIHFFFLFKSNNRKHIPSKHKCNRNVKYSILLNSILHNNIYCANSKYV